MKTPIEKTKIPTGTYMLVWFTNPEQRPNEEDGKIEQGISTQFFTALDAAERMAKILSGSRIILTGWQNGEPEYNVFWYAVKIYGAPFDISTLTVISEETRKKLMESDSQTEQEVKSTGCCMNCQRWRYTQNGKGECSLFDKYTDEGFSCAEWSSKN